MLKLNDKFYLSDDVLATSRALLGKVLVTNFNGDLTAGKIVDVEAYKAPEDKASHAYNHRRTPRTETIFAEGGISYVYLCYGIHHLFNIVTGPKDTPHAILIRGLEPVDGIDLMLKRRKLKSFSRKVSAGPGVLTQAMGITTKHNAQCLLSSDVWIEDRGIKLSPKQIVAAPRVGIDYAQEYAAKPWRFFIRDNQFVSTFVPIK